MHVDTIRDLFYNGFYIESPVGNNAFHFEQRRNKSIWVPHLKQGELSDVKAGTKIVFSEIEDEVEHNKIGLENFVYIRESGKHIFVFDNHNHAFFFWHLALVSGWFYQGSTLLHVDQHSVMRTPEEWFPAEKSSDLKAVFEFTNFVLNVGNFIQPALHSGLFSDAIIVDSSSAFKRPVPDQFILDIDLDVFSPDMDYIPNDYKIKRIKEYIERSSGITIATSPYFIAQDRAIEFLNILF